MNLPDQTRPGVPRRRGAATITGLSLAGLSLVAAACGSSSKATAPTSLPTPTPATSTGAAPATSTPSVSTSTGPTGSGPVDVLYAGSLVDLMDNYIAPAFKTATGYSFSGVSGDSGSLANEIKGKTQQGDVFISASAAKDQTLEGAANGNWVSWYATFATSPLVIGYNPQSKFAHALQTEPWYQVIDQPGFLVGRTDPATDPKGALTVTALDEAATSDNQPGLAAIAKSTSNIFPENTLVGRLQAGQLDAGFFYGVEASAAHLQTVPLTGLPAPLKTSYTITVLANAPHPAAAAAFVQYLLGAAGSKALTANGLTLASPPAVTGTAPADLQGVLSGQ